MHATTQTPKQNVGRALPPAGRRTSFRTAKQQSPLSGGTTGGYGVHFRFVPAHLLTLLIVFSNGCGTQAGPRPPTQPASGPGGSDYKHDSVDAMRVGEGPTEFWIFTPADPRPDEAPLVVFMHGWGALHPRAYGAWIQHLVRKGHIVVYPRFQFADKVRTPGDVMLASAGAALQNAWILMNEQGPVRPRTDKIAWISHSMGGVLAAKLSATASTLGLPPAGALLSVQPGGQDAVPIGDLSSLPLDTIVELMVGDKDAIAGDSAAIAIRAALSGTPGRRVEILRMRSERRSKPALVADHMAPLGVAEGFPPAHIVGGDTVQPGGPLRDHFRERRQDRNALDALDYFGFWKVGDALLDATFRGQNLEFGFGNTDQQRFMGTLSDGTPVVPLVVEPAQ